MTGALGIVGGLANAQTLQNAPAAIGAGFTQAGRTSKKPDKTAIGMSMWFSVTVADANLVADGDQSLGNWSSCSGLSVKFNTEAFDEGGDYDSPWHMPVKITYGEVTLERAIDTENAGKIELWLKQVATAWMKGDAGGSKEIARSSSTGHSTMTSNVSTTVQINLHSSMIGKDTKSNVVHSWTLRDAIPIGYTAPTLSSKSSDVAIEKLTLAHRGIESILKADSYAPRAKETSDQGALVLTLVTKDTSKDSEDGDTPVTFSFNPKAVSLTKTVSLSSAGANVVGTLEQQLTEAGELGITINGLRLEGVEAVKDVAKLMSWIDPIPPPKGEQSAPDAAQKAVESGAPSTATTSKEGDGATKVSAKGTAKEIELKLGAGLSATVFLKSVTAKYLRFTKTGLASRADVDLTFQAKRKPKPNTNPTSGGRPGGTIHTTTTGDSLAGIAVSAYGTPSAWRDIAEANGIDDPMRLPPGRVLFLAGP